MPTRVSFRVTRAQKTAITPIRIFEHPRNKPRWHPAIYFGTRVFLIPQRTFDPLTKRDPPKLSLSIWVEHFVRAVDGMIVDCAGRAALEK